MSNILIIKHGSLGDIVQISGVLRDIRETFVDKKIFILTTFPYVELLSKCPYLDGVLIDKRLPRWNILYHLRLSKMINKMNFDIVFDLQNSSRTSFYRKYLFKTTEWSSSQTTLKRGQSKKDFDNYSVLRRFEMQLEYSKVKTKYCLKPDFSWAATNVNKIINKYFGKKFILLFPFCSPDLSHKKWPYFNELIQIIKSNHANLEIAIAPSSNEMKLADSIKAVKITNNQNQLNIMELTGLIMRSSYVIANDTGPAHIAAHVDKEGVVLFGHHTTPEKVSIETNRFRAITVDDLKKLKPNDVYLKIKDKIESIN